MYMHTDLDTYTLLKYIVVWFVVTVVAYILHEGVFEAMLRGLVAVIVWALIDSVDLSFMYQKQPLVEPLDPSVSSRLVPFHFDKRTPEEVQPAPTKNKNYSEIHLMDSRWMPTGSPYVINDNTNEYALYKGLYSNINVGSGYHEYLMSANIPPQTPLVWISQNPVDEINKGVSYGGLKNGQMIRRTPLLDMSVGPRTVTAEMGMVGGGKGIDADIDDTRLTNVVYSGDLIEVTSDQMVLQRATNNSLVVLDTSIPKLRSNLSKLRFELLLKNRPLSGIKYGDQIVIKHNALIDNMNQTRLIKYGERLQSHQDGPMYELFKLVNRENVNSVDYVKYGDSMMIVCADQPGDKVYLKREADHSISCDASVDDATTFTLALMRPCETDDSHLCVCLGELILP
jgi:hypothetical protein